MYRTYRWIFLILFSFIFLVGTVHAFDLGISPPDSSLQLNRGEIYQGEVTIFGSDNDSIEVNGSAMDWSLTTKGDYNFIPMGTLKRSASPWISFGPHNFKLPPKRSQTVNYSIKVPNDANGSYWAVMMFGTVPAAHAGKEEFQISMAARVAYIIRINVNGSQPGVGTIERLQLNWNSTSKKIAATLRVKNEGGSFIRFKGHLDLKNAQGKMVVSIPFQEGLVLPDYTREFSLTDSNLQLTPGYYVGLAVADFGERSLKAVQGSIDVK